MWNVLQVKLFIASVFICEKHSLFIDLYTMEQSKPNQGSYNESSSSILQVSKIRVSVTDVRIVSDQEVRMLCNSGE